MFSQFSATPSRRSQLLGRASGILPKDKQRPRDAIRSLPRCADAPALSPAVPVVDRDIESDFDRLERQAERMTALAPHACADSLRALEAVHGHERDFVNRPPPALYLAAERKDYMPTPAALKAMQRAADAEARGARSNSTRRAI